MCTYITTPLGGTAKMYQTFSRCQSLHFWKTRTIAKMYKRFKKNRTCTVHFGAWDNIVLKNQIPENVQYIFQVSYMTDWTPWVGSLPREPQRGFAKEFRTFQKPMDNSLKNQWKHWKTNEKWMRTMEKSRHLISSDIWETGDDLSRGPLKNVSESFTTETYNGVLRCSTPRTTGVRQMCLRKVDVPSKKLERGSKAGNR